MGYIEDNLAPGERIVYMTRKHWLVLFWPVALGTLFDAAGIALIIYAVTSLGPGSTGMTAAIIAAIVLMLAGMGIVGYGAAKRSSTEIAVTDKRVLIKMGILRKRSVELFAPRIESVSVDQSLAGRIFNYGDIVVRGTGGTEEAFTKIAAPLEFRKKMQL